MAEVLGISNVTVFPSCSCRKVRVGFLESIRQTLSSALEDEDYAFLLYLSGDGPSGGYVEPGEIILECRFRVSLENPFNY